MTVAVLGPDRMLRLGSRAVRAAIGRSGVTARKQEGDGATPVGLLPLRRVFYRADRLVVPPRATVLREPTGQRDGWCDDPDSEEYNRLICLPHPARHECLWRADGAYDVVGVLGWNDDPPERRMGSAIFLHVASADFAPTEGCLAVPLDDLLGLLANGLTVIDVQPD